MSIGVSTFQPLSFQQANPLLSGLQAAQESIGQSLQNQQANIKNQYLPQTLAQQLQSEQLKNALSQIQLQYAPQMTQAELAYKQAETPLIQAQTQWFAPEAKARIALQAAQAQREQALANLPFAGHTLPGVAGQIMALESVKRMYGDNSPQYQTAKQSFDVSQQSNLSRINYQNALTDSMSTRYLTPTGKSIEEEQKINSGRAPSGRTWDNIAASSAPIPNQPLPISDEQAQRLKQIFPQQAQQAQAPNQSAAQSSGLIPPNNPLGDQYELLRQKNTTDADTRKRNLFASNIEKTLNQINVDDLTKYSGISGSINLTKEKAADALGNGSTDYRAYAKSAQAAEFLSKQARQFYGDSIQPAMEEKLNALANPSLWSRSPETAKELFNQTKNILGMEMKTYRDALQSRDVYQGNDSPKSASASNVSDPLGIR